MRIDRIRSYTLIAWSIMQEHHLILMQALLIWISIQLGGSEKRSRNQVEVFGQVLVEKVLLD